MHTNTHNHVPPTHTLYCMCCHYVSWCVHIWVFQESFMGCVVIVFSLPPPPPFWHTFSLQEHLCVPDTVNWHCCLWIFVCSIYIYWFIHSLTYACAHTRTHSFFFAHLSTYNYKVQCSPHFCCQPARPKLQLDTGKKKWIKTQSLTLLVSALKRTGKNTQIHNHSLHY